MDISVSKATDLDSAAIHFRSASAADLSLINKLMREGKSYWGYSSEGLDRFMSTFGIKDESYFQNGFGYIAQDSGGQDIGYYLFTIADGAPMLDHFFLDTKIIGQGYGRVLWQHCVQQAKLKGWSEFTFWSDPNSLGFYEHMGAKKFAERPMVTLPGEFAPIMLFDIIAD